MEKKMRCGGMWWRNDLFMIKCSDKALKQHGRNNYSLDEAWIREIRDTDAMAWSSKNCVKLNLALCSLMNYVCLDWRVLKVYSPSAVHWSDCTFVLGSHAPGIFVFQHPFWCCYCVNCLLKPAKIEMHQSQRSIMLSKVTRSPLCLTKTHFLQLKVIDLFYERENYWHFHILQKHICIYAINVCLSQWSKPLLWRGRKLAFFISGPEASSRCFSYFVAIGESVKEIFDWVSKVSKMTLFTFPRFVICPENFRRPPSTN